MRIARGSVEFFSLPQVSGILTAVTGRRMRDRKVMVTPVSEQTLTNLSVQVRKGAWSGLPAGNDGFRAGVSSWRAQKTCPLESGHGRLERPLHASQPMSMRSTDAHCGDCSVFTFVAHPFDSEA